MELLRISHKKIQNGDVKEFEKAFRRFYAPLCRFTVTFVKDIDIAEEIVQDLFCTYWKKRETIEIQSSMKSYLYQSAKNRSLKHIAHMNVRARHVKDVLELQSVEVDYPAPVEAGEIYEIVEQALHQLPERCSEIFRLSRSEGMKYEEIAQHLAISVKTVEANMGKALKHLRDKIQEYYKDTNNTNI